ncbi:MAG TPA: MXAN_5808 family serine peptidase [Myxococcota bacterium]|nr:MXAN_5808 family serine peptidase [Myxococcota bacterium]
MRHVGFFNRIVGLCALVMLVYFPAVRAEMQPEKPVRELAKMQPETPAYDLGKMEGLSWVLIQVKQDYVDPARVHPAAMLKRALEYVERRLPEVEIKMAGGEATVQVGAREKKFAVGTPATVWEMNYNLQPIFEFIGQNLESSSDPKKVEFAAIDGVLSTLDPHSNLLPPELFREMRLKTTGEFGGLGIRITIRKGVLTIISPLPDTPAARLGLKALDQIVRIGDQSTVNMPLDEAVSMLRGKPKSRVAIWVLRDGWSEPHKYMITRETIRVHSIESHMLEKRIGYIQIQDFGRHTDGDLLRHLSRLKREAKGLKGLILDLRNNAGGLMSAAVKIADLFLDKGVIVATVSYSEDSTADNKEQKSREEKRATEEGTDKDLPIVVLTNSGSASASEILAGAFKNLDRAVLMGDQTFGKGTVQILNPRVPESISDACLKLTVAEYLTPGDVSIQEIGVTPDVRLVPMVLERENVQAFAQRLSFREEDIPAHLKKHVAQALKPAEVIRYVYDTEKKDKNDEAGADDDFQIQIEEPVFKEDFEIRLARDFLLQVHSPRGSAMLDEAGAFLKQVREGEQKKLVRRMDKLGVDWSAGSAGETVGQASFEISGEGADGQGHARADSKISMHLQVKNTGSLPFFRLRAESESKFSLYDRREFLLGRVDPGQTKSWDVPVKVPRGVLGRADDVRFSFHCEGCKPPPALEKIITTQGLDRPAFGFSWQVEDPAGNGDGLIQPGEDVELGITLYNKGSGKAFSAKALLGNKAGKDLFLKAGKGRLVFGELAPGASAHKTFQFHVRKDTRLDKLPVELTIWDSDLGSTQVAMFELPVYRKKGKRPAKTKVRLQVTARRASVYSGADKKAPIVAFVPKGSLLRADLRLGKWYRLAGRKGAPGWVFADSVKRSSAGQVKKKDPLLPYCQYTPPVISLDKVPVYSKDDDRVTISGVASDVDADLRDVTVWALDDKVYLKSGAAGSSLRSLAFSVDVKLKPGPNVLTVMAREGPRFSIQKTLIITRPGGLDWKEDKTKVADGRGGALILE